MLGLWRKRRPGEGPVEAVHARLVAASRDPLLYGPGRLPDSVEGRFEALVLHVLLVMRRLRALPKPADDFAQELIDLVFAHLEIALREMGVGDFGVPKRMKKLAGAFYDRLRAYELLCDGSRENDLAKAVAAHLPGDAEPPGAIARYVVANDRALTALDFDAVLASLRFDTAPLAMREEATP